jgi:hypothetical protein
MQQISGRIFVGETIRFRPEQVYIRCGFEDCALDLDGSSFPDSSCTFRGCSFNFTGGAARTIGFLQQLWETSEMGTILETVFTQITGSKILAKQFTSKRKVD